MIAVVPWALLGPAIMLAVLNTLAQVMDAVPILIDTWLREADAYSVSKIALGFGAAIAMDIALALAAWLVLR